MTRFTHLTVLAGTLTVILATGCGQQSPLSSLSNNFGLTAQEIATLQGNGIQAELLALTDDIDDVPAPGDPSRPGFGQLPPPDFNRLRDALGLSDAQVTQIQAIVEGVREQIEAIHDQVVAGTLTRSAAREQIKTILDDQKGQIEAVLTDGQRATFETLRQQHGRQFNLDKLAETLGLTNEQKTQLESLMKGNHDQVQAIREQVEAGTLTRDAAHDQIKALHQAEKAAVATILTGTQLAQFEQILRHPRFGFGPRGFGRDPHGDHPRPGHR